MKRTGLIAAALAALVVGTGASVWEGAAAVAPAGDLPDAGYYAATNSFPRNTVVDITNLETGKSVRVIVSSGLETPGLLAMISRDTASVIGMPLRSIGRIRMIQPSDPVAFSRFNEEMASSGDPDYDPEALVAAEAPRTAETARDPAAGSEAPAPPAAAGAGEPAGTGPRAAETPGTAPPAAALVPVPDDRAPAEEPVSGGGHETIADLPEPGEPAGTVTDEGIIRETPPALAVVPGAGTEEAPAPEAGTAEEVPETAWYAGEETGDGVEIADEPGMGEGETPPDGAAEQSYVLVPGEDRPPAAADHTLPPDAEIAPLENRPPAAAAGPAEEPRPDESLFIDPVSPEPAADAEDAAPVSPFSVPLVAGLESGKYYLQIGAYSRVETVESALSKIDKAYPVAVQNAGDTENPVYRILLGPVNLGESGALLQRFKGMGYGDAFVKAAH
ncbi:MAG: SPOR domain-containing protein [Treponema sp.]|jgi:hypothetical protein|nr:SPOR domain-containing protein [Treponema sp.]